MAFLPLSFESSFLCLPKRGERAEDRASLLAVPPSALIELIDLTTLMGDDTAERVISLCKLARNPVPSSPAIQVAAICVYPCFIELAKSELEGTTIKIATVSAAFPHGQSLLSSRIQDVADCATSEVDEIDIVIRRSLAINEQWEELFTEVSLLRCAAQSKTLKVILATGELSAGTPNEAFARIYKASMVAMMAGAEFIKTSTGKEAINANLEAGKPMVLAIKEFEKLTGRKIGLKAAGGIKSYEQAIEWHQLISNNLGTDAAHPNLFRIGASSLLDDLVKRHLERASQFSID